MLGSDHRPVQLGLTLKDFDHPQFAELPRLLNFEEPRQGYGEIKIESVNIYDFDFSKSFDLKKFVTP